MCLFADSLDQLPRLEERSEDIFTGTYIPTRFASDMLLPYSGCRYLLIQSDIVYSSLTMLQHNVCALVLGHVPT